MHCAERLSGSADRRVAIMCANEQKKEKKFNENEVEEMNIHGKEVVK